MTSPLRADIIYLGGTKTTMDEMHMQIDWSKVLDSAGPYPVEAFNFVREGLSYTMNRVHENAEARESHDRHVNGQQLCLGLRDFAIEQYGLLAPTVLQHWSVQRTDDFGRIVFAMIDAGIMKSSHEDTLEDFRAIYDFSEAFSREQLLTRVSSN